MSEYVNMDNCCVMFLFVFFSELWKSYYVLHPWHEVMQSKIYTFVGFWIKLLLKSLVDWPHKYCFFEMFLIMCVCVCVSLFVHMCYQSRKWKGDYLHPGCAFHVWRKNEFAIHSTAVRYTTFFYGWNQRPAIARYCSQFMNLKDRTE